MLKSLFSPLVLRGKTVKNRATVPAMVVNYCTEDGKATERYIAYHEARAKGGWGLIITENYAVDPLGKGFSYIAGLWEDGQIDSHKELTKRVKSHGATILAQIYHAGRQTSSPVIGGTPLAPSPIICPFGMETPKELTPGEIKELVSKFGDTAKRAKEAGFDGVEVHGAHGYLVAQFMSAYSNKRFDEYGGILKNRARFAIEIVKNIREKCGEDFIISFRISVDEFVEGGRTLEESKAIAKMLEEAGVDIIHASAGVYASADAIVPPQYTKPAWIANHAEEIKKHVNIHVITVGRINDPHVANTLIESGKADFVAMGRASLTDPDLPNNVKEGREEDTRKCIACNFGCLGILFANKPIGCVLNPELGNEYKGQCTPAEKPKKVAVVGAGPAGLEAAIFAARAGHNVSVYEKSEKAGGQFYLAAVPPCKGDLAAFIAWQLGQLSKLKVDIKYNTEVKEDTFAPGEFDNIIVATGAKPLVPIISGANMSHVVQANDILGGSANAAYNVVVIGGGRVGAETANHLGVQLKNVTLVEMTGAIAAEEALAPRWHLLKSLENRKVRMMTNATVVEIKKGEVIVEEGENKISLAADTVILATGSKEDNGLANKLIEKGMPVKVIGDAKKVEDVMCATGQGYEVGCGV